MTTLNGKNIDELFDSEDFKKSLKDAECVVQYINKKYISLNDAEYTTYANHLKNVLSMLVQHMKRSNELFSALYQKEHFAGSYPDGLKIGKPTEYDMNLIIKFPSSVDSSKLQIEPGTPSFVKIKGKEIFNNPGVPPEFLKWIDDEGYLLQTKFREWIERILTKVFLSLPLDDPSDGNTRVLADEGSSSQQYKIKHKKSGPAMTLKVSTPDGCQLDVDLVPAFQFGHLMWPPPPVEALPEICKKKSWMVIPKPKKIKEGDTPDISDAREWRISFLDQERELISGSGTVKPVIKLLKKLRDSSRVVTLSSYAIKTMAMYEMKKQNQDFWKNRQVYLFLFMLHRLTEQIRTGHIPFYWDERDDLLKLETVAYGNVCNRLANILKDIVKVIDKNPFIIAEKLLSPDECKEVKENCKIPTSIKSRPSLALAIGGPVCQDETDGVRNGAILYKIFDKLEELDLGQKQIPGQVMQAFCNSQVPLQRGVHLMDSTHGECQKKQAELEERITNLEDKMQLMLSHIKRLTEATSCISGK